MKRAVGLILISACSDNSDNATHGISSCDLTDDVGYCLDFGADAPAGEAVGNCTSANDQLGYHGIASEDSPCPVSNRVGSCDATVNQVDVTYRYYGPKFTTTTAQDNCAHLPMGAGTFTAN